MSKKSNINFGSKQRKQEQMKKNVIIGIIAVVVAFVGFRAVGATTSYISDKREEKIAMQQQAEAERLEAEKKRKEEEEAKKRIIGVKPEAKQYSHDATEISKKLSNFDYSNNGEKIVFLTFDDGASTTVTPQILDVLKTEDVKATFFVTGENLERGGQASRDLVKRAFDEGNAIANHSYSHDYKYLYPSRTVNVDNFVEDFAKTDEILKDIINPYFSTRVIRCPGGHMSWNGMDALDAYLEENDMASIDWNALSGDSEGKKKNAEQLVEYAKKTSEGKEMVVLLMHDTYGKEETAKSLPEIIKYYKENGYTFKTLV